MEEKRLHDLGFGAWYGKVWGLAAAYDIHLENPCEQSAVKVLIAYLKKDGLSKKK